LAGWQGKLLNIAGRRELVRSVLSSIPTYLLTALKAPKQLFCDLDKARRRFLWAGDSELTGGKCKVAWTLVARPTEFGGLGILDLERFSRALRLRWLWYNWTNPERPWNGTELPVDSVDITLFNAATTVTVHNGKKASFWLSSWLNGQSPSQLCPLLFSHSRRKNRSVRDAVVGDRWIGDIAHSLTNALLDEFFKLWRAIQAANLNLEDGSEDTITWILESSGKYTAKSAYKIQFEGQYLSNFPKLIWNSWAPPRCKFFMWLLLQNRLWTSARLQLRGWENNYFCALCERNLETVHHLFIECPYSCWVWALVSSWSGCLNINPAQWLDVQDIETWLDHVVTTGSKVGHSLTILTLWTICKQRNARIFRDNAKPERVLFVEIKDTCQLWSMAEGTFLKPLFVVQHVVT
jgi:hypothetical protein